MILDMEKIKVIGPYLLCPAEDSMTVAFWANGSALPTLFYRSDGAWQSAAVHAASAPESGMDAPTHYLSRLTELSPETVYEYRLELPGGSTLTGTFRTLPHEPDRLRLFLISDSHSFATSAQVSEAALSYYPDFILNLGDIPAGTGFQREQYVTGWFNRIPEILRALPVVYIPGNHDDGPHYDAFFGKPQAACYPSDASGRTFSFDYGNAHFTMIDSNPWGLSEMNAYNANIPVNYQTRQRITQTLRFLEEDLQSLQAQNANWRILALHHPYTDQFTNQYIVPLAEKYHVDLLLGGHVHSYIKSVSVNPGIGGRFVAIAQGSAQGCAAGRNVGSPDRRLLTEFPEVAAMGGGNYGTLELTKEQIVYRHFGFQEGTQEPVPVDTVILTREPPRFWLSELRMDALDNHGTLHITGKAKNIGTGIAALCLRLSDNGEELPVYLFGEQRSETRVIAMDAGEKASFSAIYQVEGEGAHILSLDNIEKEIAVVRRGNLRLTHLKLLRNQTDSFLSAGIQAENCSPETLSGIPVSLSVNGEVTETQHIALEAWERKQITFLYRYPRSGAYAVCVTSESGVRSEEKSVDVRDYLCVTPRIRDLSPNRNDAYLRGNPQILCRDGENIIALRHDGDYLEIPHSDSLWLTDAFSGVVCANINRLSTSEEMAHNPLMVKGKSVGWGAAYSLRMAVDRSGAMKWGTCYDTTEYGWTGGNASLNRWSQYTLTFSKREGGDAYIDLRREAHIPPISPAACIRNFDKEPLFVGYSYIGHVIHEIGRPKYYTHLPAQIRQVRLYHCKLTEAENAAICKNPAAPGPQSDSLALWLDFSRIDYTGAHTTDWRRPTAFIPDYFLDQERWHFYRLTTWAEVPDCTEIRASIELSDDQKTIRATYPLNIQDGFHEVDLPGSLPPAQYLRIKTTFSAAVGETGVQIPRLMEYRIAASRRQAAATLVWATRSDWEKGTLEGAIGFLPSDRLTVFDDYTDVIHG